MQFIPHEYQNYAVDFVENHPVCALIISMGLGKTVITLTALLDLLFDSFLVHKILIIAPLRVARNTWPEELDKWDHLKSLEYSLISGTPQERLQALAKPADIYIINRENVPWLCSLPGWDFDTVVIDELSSFKNHKAKRYQALMAKRPMVKRIIGLTGTPSPNGLEDLWAEFKLLDMGKRLGRFIGQFRNQYMMPGRRNGYIVYNYLPLPGAAEQVYEKISDIAISMNSVDHLKMPDLVMIEQRVLLSEPEQDLYQQMKRDLVLPFMDQEITAANAAVLTGKLSQMASGAIYSESGENIHIHSRKLDMLEELIEAAAGKSVLITYWFKHDLERIQARFSVRVLNTDKDIQDWNDGKIEIAAIHPAAAGHGLNLQSGGSTMIWFSLTWSLELYQQTNARLYRQGQKETVRIYHLIAAGTIDEEIMKALKYKDVSQARLIEAVKAQF